MTESRTQEKNRQLRSLQPLQIALVCAGVLAGCSSGTTQPGAALPPAPAASNATAYIGAQGPGLWDLSVDDTQNVFSYQSLSGSATSQSGGFNLSNGVIDLGNNQGVSIGQAVAQPAGGALLRPGPLASFPVVMVQQSDCLPVTGNLRYIYAGLPGQTVQNGGDAATSTGYGTFVVSTSADGKAWSFSDVHNYVVTGLAGGPVAAGTENGTDPATFSATCSSSNGVGTVAAASNAAFNDPATGSPYLPRFVFNPAGGMVEDRGNGQSWMGFAMPQATIKPSAVAAGTYRGFVFEGTNLVPVDTRPVAFAAPATAGSTLVGGTFPNDDLSQTPGSEYSITLGAQNATLNGVFPNTRFTALDAGGNCALYITSQSAKDVQSGFDANGNATCTAAGVAVIGQLGGKYVVYFTSLDATRPYGSSPQDFPIQFYLYQQ